MLNAVAVNVVAQAERSGPLGPEFGKASPVEQGLAEVGKKRFF